MDFPRSLTDDFGKVRQVITLVDQPEDVTHVFKLPERNAPKGLIRRRRTDTGIVWERKAYSNRWGEMLNQEVWEKRFQKGLEGYGP